jgi:hypothetical protein
MKRILLPFIIILLMSGNTAWVAPVFGEGAYSAS